MGIPALTAGCSKIQKSEKRRRQTGMSVPRDLRLKNEAPAWDRGPRRVRFVVSVVFTPTRGVIHPSFPLRGRWERIVKNAEQAPSPSLDSLRNSSCETHSCASLMHGLRQYPRACQLHCKYLINKYLSSK